MSAPWTYVEAAIAAVVFLSAVTLFVLWRGDRRIRLIESKMAADEQTSNVRVLHDHEALRRAERERGRVV